MLNQKVTVYGKDVLTKEERLILDGIDYKLESGKKIIINLVYMKQVIYVKK